MNVNRIADAVDDLINAAFRQYGGTCTTSSRVIRNRMNWDTSPFRYVIGIDPGVKTGFAAVGWDSERLICTEVTDFFGVQKLLEETFGGDKRCTLVFVEQPPNFTYGRNRGADDKAEGGDYQAMSAGGNRREAQLLAEALRRAGWNIEQVAPVPARKWTQEQFQIGAKTKVKAQEHERDAARLALHYLKKRKKEK